MPPTAPSRARWASSRPTASASGCGRRIRRSGSGCREPRAPEATRGWPCRTPQDRRSRRSAPSRARSATRVSPTRWCAEPAPTRCPRRSSGAASGWRAGGSTSRCSTASIPRASPPPPRGRARADALRPLRDGIDGDRARVPRPVGARRRDARCGRGRALRRDRHAGGRARVAGGGARLPPHVPDARRCQRTLGGALRSRAGARRAARRRPRQAARAGAAHGNRVQRRRSATAQPGAVARRRPRRARPQRAGQAHHRAARPPGRLRRLDRAARRRRDRQGRSWARPGRRRDARLARRLRQGSPLRAPPARRKPGPRRRAHSPPPVTRS